LLILYLQDLYMALHDPLHCRTAFGSRE